MKKIIIVISMFLVIFFLYGFYINPHAYKIHQDLIKVNNLPESFNGFKIVQFSDVLINSENEISELANIVNSINDLKPDIIVFTGDLFKKDYIPSKDNIIKTISYLSKLDCTSYKYSIIGDNDQKQIDIYNQIFTDSNFRILDNKSEYLFYKDITPIKITGLTNIEDLDDALVIQDNLDTSLNILLTHYPDYIDTISTKDIDIVLSGHSLNGQIRLPFLGGIIKKDNAQKYIDHYYELNDTKLYISSGLGEETTDFRTFNKPEINLYRIEKD